MSERQYLTNELVAYLSDADEIWNAPFGVLESKSADGKYREVTFGRAAILDASIKVYSPSFVTLTWRTAMRKMPSHGFHVFKGGDVFANVVKFLEESFS